MSSSKTDEPQITRGRAQDVHRLMTKDFSKFFRPSSSSWLMKEPMSPRDTLQKLESLKNQFTKYCNIKIPERYIPHCQELQEYVVAAISLIKRVSNKHHVLDK
jgi:hypothetical protein